jgi:hypothetical protein
MVIDELARYIKACDPQAEIIINLCCPACNNAWQNLFDITTFLWDEIEAQAKKLLAEVHQLAFAYGWHEQHILALSTARRRYYLDRIS